MMSKTQVAIYIRLVQSQSFESTEFNVLNCILLSLRAEIAPKTLLENRESV